MQEGLHLRAALCVLKLESVVALEELLVVQASDPVAVVVDGEAHEEENAQRDHHGKQNAAPVYIQ